MLLGEVRGAARRATLTIRAETVAGALEPDVEVLVNGRDMEFLAGLDTRLQPTNQVTVFYSGVRGFPSG